MNRFILLLLLNGVLIARSLYPTVEESKTETSATASNPDDIVAPIHTNVKKKKA